MRQLFRLITVMIASVALVGSTTAAANASAISQNDLGVAATPHCTTFGHMRAQAGGWPFMLKYPALSNSQNASGNCILDVGDTNSGVFILQDSLKECYPELSHIKLDAIYGGETLLAVAIAQGKHGITQDGVYGPATGLTMKWRTYIGVPGNEAPLYGPQNCKTMSEFQQLGR
jgi:hypothetical protein